MVSIRGGGGEVGQQLLELCECPPSLVRVLGVKHDVVRQCIGDKIANTPVIAGAVQIEILAILSSTHMECASLSVRILEILEFVADMERNSLHIVNEFRYPFEDNAIDALNDIIRRHRSRHSFYMVCVVNMAGSIRCNLDVAVNQEPREDWLDRLQCVGVRRVIAH